MLLNQADQQQQNKQKPESETLEHAECYQKNK